MIPVYSISKPFLAQAVLELGLSLDSAVGEHLDGLAPVYANRRIDHLLNHTSGLGDYGFLSEYHAAVEARESAWSRAELLERCLVMPHNTNGFQYSNIGYLLLRMLVEQATGMSYFGALAKLVFEPLGLRGLAEWELETDIVPGYDPRWVYSGTFLAEPAAISPALVTLAKHRENTIGLSSGVVGVNHENTGFDRPGYGFGFMMNIQAQAEHPRFVGHGGGGPGFGLMALVNTSTWVGKLEYSTSKFNQTEAILRLTQD